MARKRSDPLLLGPTPVGHVGDVELVAFILGATRTRAARLLDRAGGLVGLGRLGVDEPLLMSAIELGQRVERALVSEERFRIGSIEAVERWARPRLATLEHEELWVLSVDGRNGLKSARRVAQGGAHGCALTPRDVLTPALRDSASAIVLVHNHPSGEPAPSPEDLAMTRAVAEACEVVGIELLDHVVVARRGAASVFGARAEQEPGSMKMELRAEAPTAVWFPADGRERSRPIRGADRRR